MLKDKKTDTAKEEEKETADAETTEDETKDEEEDTSSTDLDLDEEIEKEKKRGKPDQKIASEAFKQRQAKRKDIADIEEEDPDDKPLTRKDIADIEEEDPDDKPLTRKDIADIEARSLRKFQEGEAMKLARSMTTSEKEAQLVFLKWQNRQFPGDAILEDQLEEAFVITHKRKLMGERNEALRALKNKDTVNKDGSSSHRDGPTAGEPKLSEADRTAYQQAGFAWDGTKRLYTKAIGRGKTLCKDPKSDKIWTV